MIRKQKFSIPLFIIAGLSTFIILALFFILFKMLLFYKINQTSNQSDKYFFKNFSQGDPLTTKIPDINDILAGPIISQNDPSLGPIDAPITLVIFSDFECKFCQTQERIIKAIMEQFQGKIRLIWKDYPENNLNSTSFKAAIAARCANLQNKFWEYHDILFQNKENLNQDNFISFANQLNLDKNQFENCLENNDIKKIIKDNMDEANALNIIGIPFIYLNDQEVMGELTINDLKKMVENELNKNKN